MTITDGLMARVLQALIGTLIKLFVSPIIGFIQRVRVLGGITDAQY